MPLEVHPIEDDNILVVETIDPFDMIESIHELHAMIENKLERLEGTLHCINDVREASISFSDLVSGLGVAFTGDLSVFSHPRLHMIVVSENAMVKMGSKAASQQSQYGKVPIKVFANVDDAIVYARSNPERIAE